MRASLRHLSRRGLCILGGSVGAASGADIRWPFHGDARHTRQGSSPTAPRLVACEEAAPKPLRVLYPDLAPAETGFLTTSDGKHRLYYEVSGNPRGKPALFLHGGPGDGSSSKHRRQFDPAVFRIVVFDQRGAGRSLPPGSLEDNTTPALVEDIELLRQHLGIGTWALVVGGSWGSTLALTYAQAHPAMVQHMVLYSVFLPSRRSIDWLYSLGGASEYYPDAYEAFVTHLPPAERQTPLQSYHARLRSPDPLVRLPARASLARWTLTCLALTADEEFIASVVSKPEDLGLGSLIETHYMTNGCFVDEVQLLQGCKRIRDIPCAIVHGRHDMLCPPSGAWRLHRALPLSRLQIVPESGHSSSAAPRLRSAVLEAIDGFKR